ncbi:MAG: outer membrane lipoprotein-sorting protein [Acidobacteria bacterium]|nr:outer membrane lipoprotein-sorting protein [Acidobacteriota bacterium]
MKRIAISLAATVAFIGCGGVKNDTTQPTSSPVASNADRGNQIVADYQKDANAPFRQDHVRFTIRSEKDPVQIYEIDVWRRNTDSETDTLSIITKPAEDAGTGSLAIERPGEATVNMTYAASRDEYRETDTGKMFFGGLTAQELLGEWNKYDFKYLGDKPVNGRTGSEVEGHLRKGETSTIDSVKATFDTETHVLLEMHLFDNTGKELRTYTSGDIKEQSGHKYVARTEVENHVYNSHITIEVITREYPASIDNSFFQREKLKTFVRK